MKKRKPSVKLVKIDSLILDPKNARTHDDRNLSTIGSSLDKFGQVEMLVVQKGSGRVIAGHGRIEAAKALGEESLYVNEIECTDVEAKDLAIRLNRSAELASWNNPQLAESLAELQFEDIEIADLGFSQIEFDALVERSSEPKETTAPEEFKEFNEEIETDYCCPKCSYKWSGKPK